MRSSPQDDQRVAENNQLTSTESPERDRDQQNVNIPPHNAHPDFNDVYATYLPPRHDIYNRGESTKDCAERLRLQDMIRPLSITLTRVDGAWVTVKGLLDDYYALLPAFRNRMFDHELKSLYLQAIRWYNGIFDNKENRDEHLGAVYESYSANPRHQILLPFTSMIATFEKQRGHRAFSELSRVNAFSSYWKKRIRETQWLSPWLEDFSTVEHARKRLEELEGMNLKQKYDFLQRVCLELIKIKIDIKAQPETSRYDLPLDMLRNELNIRIARLTDLYIKKGIPRRRIVYSPAGHVEPSPRISELRSLIENMYKEVADLNNMPSVEERIGEFLTAYTAPLLLPPRVPPPPMSNTE